MARGYIYYISTNNNPDVSFNGSDYYDKLDSMNIYCVEEQTAKESKVTLEYLAEFIRNIGADIYAENKDSVFAFSFRLTDAETVKHNYFETKLNALKKQVNALTVSDVICSAPALDFIVNNECGDLVAGMNYLDITLDDFIRQLQSDVTYYVYKRVILMR